MTAVPASAATTTINTFKPNVRILEFSPERAIDQKRRFQENTPAPASGGGAHEPFPAQAANVPATAGRINGPHHAPCVRSRMEPKALASSAA